MHYLTSRILGVGIHFDIRGYIHVFRPEDIQRAQSILSVFSVEIHVVRGAPSAHSLKCPTYNASMLVNFIAWGITAK